MECFICQNPVNDEENCPYCGADLKAYRRILLASQTSYNEGLRRAQIRDLSGAIELLNRSLKYNKYNREARNLLGLVYFESGETVRALNEWVISKNFFPESNPVDKYLGVLQNGPNTLDKLNQTAKKYNQALIYTRQNSEDLAILQLKRVIQMNPNMIAARLLLALIHLKNERYDDAKKEVSAVLKIDSGNVRAISYMQEIRAVQKEQHDSGKKKKKKKNADMADGAEINMSTRASFGVMEGTGGAFLNILLGAVIGLIICMFLIVPNVRQEATREASQMLLGSDEKASASAADISALERQIEVLQAQLDNYEGKSDQKASYENLIKAQGLVNAEEQDLDGAKELLAKVSPDLLDSNGQELFKQLSDTVNVYVMETNYAEGLDAMREEDYPKAIEMLKSVVEIDETYNDGDALYNLAQCYAKNQETVNAANTYNKIIELFKDTRLARQAENAIKALGEEDSMTDEVMPVDQGAVPIEGAPVETPTEVPVETPVEAPVEAPPAE